MPHVNRLSQKTVDGLRGSPTFLWAPGAEAPGCVMEVTPRSLAGWALRSRLPARPSTVGGRRGGKRDRADQRDQSADREGLTLAPADRGFAPVPTGGLGG